MPQIKTPPRGSKIEPTSSNPAKLRRICGQCWQDPGGAALERDPNRTSAIIGLSERISQPDPKDPNRTISTFVTRYYNQTPALVCIGCLADDTDVADADPIFVGKPKK